MKFSVGQEVDVVDSFRGTVQDIREHNDEQHSILVSGMWCTIEIDGRTITPVKPEMPDLPWAIVRDVNGSVWRKHGCNGDTWFRLYWGSSFAESAAASAYKDIDAIQVLFPGVPLGTY